MKDSWTSFIRIKPDWDISEPLEPIKQHEHQALLEMNHVAVEERSDFKNYLEADGFPIPNSRDREFFFGDKDYEYWVCGLSDYFLLQQVCKDEGVPFNQDLAYADLGAASGRVVRHFIANHRKAKEFWGIDLNRNNIDWMRKYLPKNLNCFQNTSLPHLPLPDASLDMVSAFSVFAHIEDFEQAWLYEIRRILKPGGICVISFYGERLWHELDGDHFIYRWLFDHNNHILNWDIKEELFQSPMPKPRVAFTFDERQPNRPSVFFSDSYIHDSFGRAMEVRKIIPRAHVFQDVVVLRKE